MVTVTGRFQLPDGSPDSGTVRLTVASPAVLRDADPAMITAAEVRADLDGLGRIEVDVVASDDPGWATEGPVPYRVAIRTEGLRADYPALILGPGPVDIADLVALDGPPDVVAVPGPPGPPATWA